MSVHWVFVDDGSRDATHAMLEEGLKHFKSAQLVTLTQNSGKGAACRAGVLAVPTTADHILYMDADLATALHHFIDVAHHLGRKGLSFDGVIGCRSHPLAEAKRHWFRRAMGLFFAWWVRRNLGLSVRDTQCGFKVFRADLARDLFMSLESTRFEFDIELLLRAQARGARLLELPVDWQEQPGSRVHIFKDTFKMLWAVWRMRSLTIEPRTLKKAA